MNNFIFKKLAMTGLACLCLSGCSSTESTTETAASISVRNPAWATPMSVKALPNLNKLNDEVYRSAQPETNGLTAAKELGIKTVLSLRETKTDPKLEEKEQTGLNLIHIPIVTWNVKDQNLIDAMKVFKDAPKPILVHCRHGADRTGLIIALYRIIYEGWTKEEAKTELFEGGYGFHSIWQNIPKEIDEADIDALKQAIFGDSANYPQPKQSDEAVQPAALIDTHEEAQPAPSPATDAA